MTHFGALFSHYALNPAVLPRTALDDHLDRWHAENVASNAARRARTDQADAATAAFLDAKLAGRPRPTRTETGKTA